MQDRETKLPIDWADLQKKVPEIVRLGYHEDATSALSHWHLPLAHYLESWGDAQTSDGTLVPIQPLIAPLFGGLTELEVLARLARSSHLFQKERSSCFQSSSLISSNDGSSPTSSGRSRNSRPQNA